MSTEPRADVILFKQNGKYYTTVSWRIPANAIGPYDMARSPDFKPWAGPMLVETQEPWGYPHLFPALSADGPKCPHGVHLSVVCPWCATEALLGPDRTPR